MVILRFRNPGLGFRLGLGALWAGLAVLFYRHESGNLDI